MPENLNNQQNRLQDDFSSGTYVKNADKQSGFIMMLLLVIMVVGAGVYFSQYAENVWVKHQSEADTRAVLSLHEIKQKLLTYAVFQPELYESYLVSNTVTYRNIDKIPGPGYFPCPDLDGDGQVLGAETNCGNPRVTGNNTTGFTSGYLPIGFATRNIYFGAVKPKQYYYVVDERFVNGNNKYNNGTTGRYAPLNSTLTPASAPDASPGAALPNNTPPWISLNGVSGYVALIILPATASSGFDAQNTDGDRFFVSKGLNNPGVGDSVIGITFDEWKVMVEHRICSAKNDLLTLNVSTPHWFNDYDSVNIPSGGNWRGLVGGCP